jgi:hypothetical protein
VSEWFQTIKDADQGLRSLDTELAQQIVDWGFMYTLRNLDRDAYRVTHIAPYGHDDWFRRMLD